jgi:hypothetical protein
MHPSAHFRTDDVRAPCGLPGIGASDVSREAVGVTAECRLPGLYVRVIEGELAPHREVDCFARRLSTPDHRLPPDQAVIRPRRMRRQSARPNVAISPEDAVGLPAAETIVHSCAPGEGPPAPIPDPEGKSPHPLVYRGVTPLRSRNPAVGYAQYLLNFFLAEMRAGTHECPGANATMRAYMARNLAALEANGQLPLAVDCRFGPNTQLATKIFQTCRGILVDGKIGPVTWPLLKHFERVAPRPTPAPTPSAPSPCPPATCTPTAPFLPSRFAFRFANSFSVAIPLPGRLPTLSGGFGLCGGMATAAQDHFLTCVPRPSTTTPPVHGDPLFAYLLSRQLDSLGSPTFGPVLKFVEWTNRPDTSTTALGRTIVDGVQELTVPEFRAVVRRLRAGELVVLGLVYVGPRSVRIHENHQVLAYKQTTVSATETDLHVYDPNAPLNDNVTIRCTMAASGRRVQCEQRFGASGGTRNVRGFFQMPYGPQTPPCLP